MEVGKLDSDYLNELEGLVQTNSNLDHGKGARYEVQRILTSFRKEVLLVCVYKRFCYKDVTFFTG